MGRKKLSEKEKKVRLSIWKLPNEIAKLGGPKPTQVLLGILFDEQIGLLPTKNKK